jgi:hypothetical protein
MLITLYNIDKNIYFDYVRQNGVIPDLYQAKSLFTNENIIKFLKDLGYNNLSIPVTTQINLYLDFQNNIMKINLIILLVKNENALFFNK